MGTSAFVAGCVLLGMTGMAATAMPATAAPGRTAPGRAAPGRTAPAARPVQLPPAPAIGQTQYTIIAFAGRPTPIKVTWPALPRVSRFRAQWTDAGARADIDLPGTATAFERPEAPPGHHDLSIVAIDEHGIESHPTVVTIDVVAVTAIPPGGDAAHPAPGPAFAIGSKFTSPGLACQLGSAPAASEAVATAFGATRLACGGEPGQPRVEVPVVIAPVVLAGPTQPIMRETPTQVHITLGSVAPVGDRLQVEAIGDLDLGDAERSAMGIDVPVTALAGAANAGLVIRAGAIELGRIKLALVDRPPQGADEPQIHWFALDIGGHLGALLMTSDGRDANALGTPNRAADTLTSAPLFGARAGLFPTRHVGIESELSLAVPGYRGHSGLSPVVSARAQLAVRLVEDGRYGLRLIGGAGMLGVLTSSETSRRTINGAVHGGGAFTVEMGPDLWLRIEALDVITAAQDAGYAHCMELQLGLVTRLGRRD